jgi:Putative zinc-finger
MNCTDVRAALPALLYEDVSPQEAAALRAHLADCPDCRAEQAALQRLGTLLTTVPAPAIRVDLARLYHEDARREHQRLRRWRRAALCSFAAAAVVLLALAVGLELRVDHHQVVLRWGTPPVDFGPLDAPPSLGKPGQGPAAVNSEQLRLVTELVHALADDAAARDRVNQESLALLQVRLDALQRQAQDRWNATERYVSALHTLTAQTVEKE